ncbi:hypothetical protein WL88_14505 [Burkholderia diffusa]|uniref:Acriflavin resistance protein n=1 Tax=Burkholderia diffusa TaxID=488732 RepID=A0AAW3PGS7_9BURK|nr:hypothetical protein WL85_00670 [Burkholderia diffusa]KWF45572.1 hypothetical protein WL86_06505 [Burkholderia diffusa]KWF53688.1 hypothetical protein WL88_14505 [Burkholderia diffusa]KWF53845.1 hypothetical protein WL87_12340 [Burkholderia diffusa]
MVPGPPGCAGRGPAPPFLRHLSSSPAGVKRHRAHCASRCGLAPRFGSSPTGRRAAPADTSPLLELVRLALARPYTFIVLALLILIAGPLAAVRTPTDIFPDIRIPIIGVVWNNAGLQPADMAGRIVTYHERTLGTAVNDVAHIESQSRGTRHTGTRRRCPNPGGRRTVTRPHRI